jgi:hypothetical protein
MTRVIDNLIADEKRPLDGSFMDWIDESQITIGVLPITYKPNEFLLEHIAESESDNKLVVALKRERDDLIGTHREHTAVLEDAKYRVK